MLPEESQSTIDQPSPRRPPPPRPLSAPVRTTKPVAPPRRRHRSPASKARPLSLHDGGASPGGSSLASVRSRPLSVHDVTSPGGSSLASVRSRPLDVDWHDDDMTGNSESFVWVEKAHCDAATVDNAVTSSPAEHVAVVACHKPVLPIMRKPRTMSPCRRPKALKLELHGPVYADIMPPKKPNTASHFRAISPPQDNATSQALMSHDVAMTSHTTNVNAKSPVKPAMSPPVYKAPPPYECPLKPSRPDASPARGEPIVRCEPQISACFHHRVSIL